ncbi:MAG: putative cointegrate resolution protein [Hydrocarboniphaga sp.]|uniref:DNA-binding protein n=1 Tax=Hydrocarboniphaga sp. TaxID=2033016 RepID=UPI00260E5DEC|nr:DNA-binding protein [Hydrocarboniphaga sp.]MDB5970096.1 putative cointegrate resolution protein [Hydrocarboniphaga sp.]
MPRGITEQDVFQAADLLLERGDRPTIERVRQELGTGSPNTVNRHLDAWWSTLAKRMAGKLDAENLPAALADLCRKLYDGIRQQAGRDAQEALVPDRDALARDRERLAAERLDLAHERSSVSALIETLRTDLAHVSAQNSTSAGRIAALETTLDAEKARTREAELRAQTLSTEWAHSKDQSAREIERIRGQWEGNERRWLAEIDELRTAAKRAAAEKEKEFKLLRATIDTSAKDLANKDVRLASLQASMKGLEIDLARERESRIVAEGELVGLRRSFDGRSGPAKRQNRGIQKRARV